MTSRTTPTQGSEARTSQDLIAISRIFNTHHGKNHVIQK
jgi:hypothetical protein